MIKNQHGYILVHLIAFLPLILALMFAFYSFLAFSDTYIEIKNTCLREQIETLVETKKSLRSLLKLNPRASQLHLRYISLKTKETLAIAAGNWPLAAKYKIEAYKVLQKRQVLDQTQKALIRAANTYLRTQDFHLKDRIRKIGQERKHLFLSFLDLDITSFTSKLVTLAVEADSERLAPNYSLTKDFIEKQALQLTWELKIESLAANREFLPFKHQFSQGCSTTINSKEDKWPTVIREVKFLLKPL